MKMYRILLCFLVASLSAFGADNVGADNATYRLFGRDLIKLAVRGEPDLTVERRVDGLGEINVPLLGQVKVAGLSLVEVQTLIAKSYAKEEIFVSPEVVVTVVEYSPKEVMVLGQVVKQGKQTFSPEATTMTVVEAITSAGGFTRIAKSDAVRVTRKDERGVDQSFTVNVEKMIDGRGAAVEPVLLQPADVVFVPERVF